MASACKTSVSEWTGDHLAAQAVKNLPAVHKARVHPWVGKAPGGGKGNPRQHPCLENPWTEGPGCSSAWGHRGGHN